LKGLSTLIFLIITIASFVQKAQKEQKGTGKSRNTQKQHPGRQYRQPAAPARRNLQGSQYGGDTAAEKGAAAYGSTGEEARHHRDIFGYESEGIEAEERSTSGSLVYNEQDNSTEGMGYEPAAAKRHTELHTAAEDIDDWDFEITGEELLKSVLLAEVLGPPRALKRNIK